MLSALGQRWRVGLQHNNSLAANAGSFNHYLMQQRATDRSPERAPAGTTESPRRLGWPAVLALNFLPGVATVALVGVLHPAIESLRWPPVVAYTCAIGLVTLGELAVLARQAQRLSGTWDPRRAVALTARLPFRAAVIPIVGFILVAAGLAALLDPVASAISARLAHVVPGWLSADTDATTVATYGRTAVMVALSFNFLIDVIASPYVEELYWKGYLMRRIPARVALQPVALAILFAAQHFWQPGEFLLVALLQAAIGSHAQRTNSLTVAIWTHWLANGIVTVLTIREVLA